LVRLGDKANAPASPHLRPILRLWLHWRYTRQSIPSGMEDVPDRR
jgi:hypothetical protein